MPTDSGGHWLNTTEVKKLSQYFQVPGVLDENIKRGNPLTLLPLASLNHTGTSFKWLRREAAAEGDVVNINPSGKTTRVWTDSIEYVLKEAELRGCNLSRLLNQFNATVYGTYNDYEKVVADEMDISMLLALGNKLIYDDETYGSQSIMEMDGLHARAAENYGQNWDIDAAETALKISDWRKLIDEAKHGIDFFLVPYFLPRRLSAMLQEKGTAGLISTTAGALGAFTWNVSDFGRPILQIDNIPMFPSDFLVAEQANTGMGSNARAKYTTGTKMYSLFGIKKGQSDIRQPDPGVKIVYGNVDNASDFSNLEYFSKLEQFVNTKGLSETAYTQVVVGSKYGVSRIFDFTDADLTS